MATRNNAAQRIPFSNFSVDYSMVERKKLSSLNTKPQSQWIDLFTNGQGKWTLLLNLGVGLHALDVFIINTIMPSIIADIGGISFYTWASMIYMVGSIVGAAAGYHLRVRFGKRNGYLWSGLVVLIGTIGCAIPPDMFSLLIARFVKGLGGGFVIAQTTALLRDYFNPIIRTRMLSTITTTWSIAALLGPFFGGFFAEIGWWRGSFWSQVPIILIFMWGSIRTIAADSAQEPNRRLPWRRLIMLASGVITIGITSQIADLFTNLGLICLSCFLVWLTFLRDEKSPEKLFPTKPLSFFNPVGLAYWVYFLISALHSSLLMFAPLFLQEMHTISPLYIGYLSLVFSIGWTIGSLSVSGLSGIPERVASVAGMVAATVFILTFTWAVLVGSLIWLTITITLVGIAVGTTNVLMITFGMSVAHDGEDSITASSMQTIRSLGVAYGAAAAGLIANSAGLAQNTDLKTLENVAIWVLSATALTPALCALLCLRAVTWGWNFRKDK
mgnify:CR=1 FL=1